MDKLLQEILDMDGYAVPVSQAAKLLGVSPTSFYRSLQAGQTSMQYFFSGKSGFVSRADLLAFCGYGKAQDAGGENRHPQPVPGMRT